jgi:hypothetical protein
MTGKQDETDTATERALEQLTEQMRIQNAVLLELVQEQRRANRIAMKQDPDDFSRPGTAKSIEDNVLHLEERVDLDAVRRAADVR